MIDISTLDLAPQPEPDFGDDLVGQVASFMHQHKREAFLPMYLNLDIREANKVIGTARKKSARAWGAMLDKLRDDQHLIGVLDDKGLLQPLNEITAVIAEGWKRHPDNGSPPRWPHIEAALMAADEFFPNTGNLSETARTLNDALLRVGLIDDDRTESIRQALMRRL